MTEQSHIDPFSHPDSEERPLREAAEEAYNRYSEIATGKKTGVRAVGIGVDRIYFYVRNERVKKTLPKVFMGWDCEARVTGEPKPLGL